MMEPQKVILSTDLRQTLTEAIAECPHDKLFVLVDETTEQLCLPVVADYDCMQQAQRIVIGATDTHKTLDSLSHVWSELQRMGATRHSLMVNLGGGMVTDLGGFAASTFKRGLSYINIPTTLLAMVDASVGGKTGINFGGLKNEIGVFNNANSVILDTIFLRTMDRENLHSGYAEMLKHGLISNVETWAELMTFEPGEAEGLEKLGRMVADSVAVKQRIVTEDPTEHGIRKALNLGHTMGHAFESLALERQPLLHGYAVAYGLVAELYLCCTKTGFPQDKVAAERCFHQRALRSHEHHLRRLSTTDRTDAPRQEEPGQRHQLHTTGQHWRHTHQPDCHRRGNQGSPRFLQRILRQQEILLPILNY